MGAISARLTLAIVTAVYLGALLLSYVFVIAPSFTYLGFEFSPTSAGMLALGAIAALLPTTWMPIGCPRPSALSYYILYLLLYIPACFVPLCTLIYEPQRYLPYLACMAICFWGMSRIYSLRLLRLKRPRFTPVGYWTFVALFSGAISVAIISSFGIPTRIPSLREEIYDLRYEYQGVLAGTYLAYFVTAQTKVISPLLIIWGLHKRLLPLLLLGVGSQLLVFLHAGIRTVLFSPVLIIGLYFALKIRREKLFVSMVLALISVVGLARIADVTLDKGQIYYSSTFVRRMLLTPGILSGYYYDFFSENPKTLYGHSLLEGIVEYPYSDTPPKLVAAEYFGSKITNANAGFWADGYANLGMPGVVLTSALLGLTLWVFDSLAKGVDNRVASLMLAMPSMALVNSALLTVLLTHGLVLGMILLHTMPRPRASTRRRPTPTRSLVIRRRRPSLADLN